MPPVKDGADGSRRFHLPPVVHHRDRAGAGLPPRRQAGPFGATVVRARVTERFAFDSGLEVALRFDRDDKDPHLDLFLPFSVLLDPACSGGESR